jgi:citrate lyase beta subunit
MNLHPRSMLFVSGEKAERFPKAVAAGADLVCIDLEDAVHPARKDEARTQVLAWLAQRPAGTGAIALRINGVRTTEGLRDLLALVDSTVQLDALLLPKVEHAADLQCVQAWLGARTPALVALIETPLGVENAHAIALAGGRTTALMLGGADLSAELGARFDAHGLHYARGRLVNAAKAASLQAWDVPHVDLSDTTGLLEETRSVLALGYDCKTAIHPQQLVTIHAAFTPTPAETDWARTLLEAVPAGQASGAFLFRGRMVDAPLLRKARRIAELTATAPHHPTGD